jgi:hypothetical protein
MPVASKSRHWFKPLRRYGFTFTGGATMAGKSKGKRELINTGTDKRFVRRDAQGKFKESDDVGRSLSSDRRRKAKTTSKSGQGDRGDRKR